MRFNDLRGAAHQGSILRAQAPAPVEQEYETLSPFEFKDKLIALATSHQQKSAYVMLNAGRGNPNWTAATPREGFFALGQFAVEECRRTWNEGDLAGKPIKAGSAERLEHYLRLHSQTPGVQWLQKFIRYGTDTLHFDADDWVHQLTDGIIGDNYPVPDRMLGYCEEVIRKFLYKELYSKELYSKDPSSKANPLQLFGTEGATAAMCYLFDSLLANFLLHPGDKVAVMVPVFPPYVEIPQLSRFNFDVVEIRATAMNQEGWHTWQYPQKELEKLRDPSIKALFTVNPSNPPSVAMDEGSLEYIADIVHIHHPNLMVISDDVYATFADNYVSLAGVLPYNTLAVYSFSKYFGVTGWRLGVMALAQENVYDRLLSKLPQDEQSALAGRYASITRRPEQLNFIQRLVADSRQVALNHTAGLSTPQQVQMAMLAGFALLDENDEYKHLTRHVCRKRKQQLYQGLHLPEPNVPHSADYYTEFDLEEWATRHYGAAFTQYLKEHYEPVDIVLRLAQQSSIVLLNGGGFRAPRWSIRVSLANLPDDAYTQIGAKLHQVLEDYVAAWRGSLG